MEQHDQEVACGDRTSAQAHQSCEITILSKQTCPFGEDVPSNVLGKKKEGMFHNCKGLPAQKDLKHMDEIKCALCYRTT